MVEEEEEEEEDGKNFIKNVMAPLHAVKDGVSSIKRCVQNNFADVHRQQVTPR